MKLHLRVYPTFPQARHAFNLAVASKASLGMTVKQHRFSIVSPDENIELRFVWANSSYDTGRYLGLRVAKLWLHEGCTQYVRDFMMQMTVFR